MNTTHRCVRKISRLLRTVSQPTRLRILLAIGEGETCDYHLEALLGYRQAYISRHLMALSEVRLLDTCRDGRYIFSRLRDLQLLEPIQMAERGIPVELAAITTRNSLPQYCYLDCVV
jgi:ArsR family transcriptional regulator